MCDKHPKRRRPSSCEICAREIEEEKNKLGPIKEDITEANISLSEPIAIENQVVSHIDDIKPVIEEISKPDTTISEEILDNISEETNVAEESAGGDYYTPAIIGVEGLIAREIDEDNTIISKNKIIPNKKSFNIDEYFNEKLEFLKEQVGHICNISYEHLPISLASFNKKVINELEDDGWRVLSMLTGILAANSGFEEDTVLFQRVKTKFRKYTKDETCKRCAI